jgi:hypothetical protein
MALEHIYEAAAKIVLSLLAISLAFYISSKTRILSNLSGHKGIKAFRQAFIFLGLAFVVNIPIVYLKCCVPSSAWIAAGMLLFNYLLSMGGFLLVYSQLWKHFDSDWKYLLHAAGITISVLDLLVMHGITLLSQLLILGYAITVSYANYSEKKQPMRQLFFISFVVVFFGFAVNLLSLALLPVFPLFWLVTYTATVAGFVIVSFAVARSLGGKDGEA